MEIGEIVFSALQTIEQEIIQIGKKPPSALRTIKREIMEIEEKPPSTHQTTERHIKVTICYQCQPSNQYSNSWDTIGSEGTYVELFSRCAGPDWDSVSWIRWRGTNPNNRYQKLFAANNKPRFQEDVIRRSSQASGTILGLRISRFPGHIGAGRSDTTWNPFHKTQAVQATIPS